MKEKTVSITKERKIKQWKSRTKLKEKKREGVHGLEQDKRRCVDRGECK